MTTPKPDLELRRRVLETQLNCYGNIDVEKGIVIKAENKGLYTDISECPHYDLSFDAILPLVRGLTKYSQQQTALHYRLYDWWEINVDTDYDFTEWLIYEATPTDYCLAYLAAMEGK